MMSRLIFFLSTILICNATGISDKLDFGETEPEPPEYKDIRVEGIHDDFDKIGVVCTSGGCNKTSSSTTIGDTIKTDVVVHVQTQVELKKNNTADATPDVPIVIGHAGANTDGLDEPNRRQDSPTVILSDFDISNLDQTLRTGSNFGYNSPLPYANPAISNLDPISSPYSPYSPDEIRTVTLTMNEIDRALRRNQNEYKMQMQIPYYMTHQHLNRHYYGETPPHTVMWNPKKSSFNPVEFKNVYKPSWNSGNDFNRGQIEKCSCPGSLGSVGRAVNPSWQSVNRRIDADPGTQINDKLAPLN